MNGARQVFEELQKFYQNHQFPKNCPSIEWKSIGKQQQDLYQTAYASGTLTLKADSFLAAIVALQTTYATIKSGHLVDFQGSFSSLFNLRPLWIESNLSNLFKNPSQWHTFCKKILELGYNAILFQLDSITEKENDFCQFMQQYGLKVLLKFSFFSDKNLPSKSPLDKKFKAYVREKIEKLNDFSFDYLFWESLWQTKEYSSHPDAEDYTFVEIVSEEVRLVEKSLSSNIGLIFYLSGSDEIATQKAAAWMQHLANEMLPSSTLAFSALSGEPHLDHLGPHPFWEQLRQSPQKSFSSFLPILNIGHLKQGEGLWPILTFDLLDYYLPRCRNANFIGFLCLTPDIPNDYGFLHCNLWVAAQAMWRSTPSCLLLETWIAAFRPEWNSALYTGIFSDLRSLSKQITHLRSITLNRNCDHLQSQECRQVGETLLMQLNCLQGKLHKHEIKKHRRTEKISLFDYFIFFSIDIRRLVTHIFQCCHLSLPHALNESDDRESFWTKGLGNSKILLLESPNKGTPQSKLHGIYQENRWLN